MIRSILINGMIAGSVYAVLAVGFSLVFGVAKILNMAHTAFYMIAAFFIYTAAVMLGLPLLVSGFLAIVFVGILGIGSYRLLLDRVKMHGTSVMIITFALAMLSEELLMFGFGARIRGIPPFVPGSTDIFEVRVAYQDIFAIGASLAALGGVWMMLFRTRMGDVIRAIAQDSEIANLMGIDVSRVYAITIGVGSILAGVAGAVIAPIFMVYPRMWLHPLIIVLASVVLGGLGSVKGSVVGAFILGFAETAAVFLIPGGSFLRGAVSLFIMVVVLIVKPEGLFGVVFEDERL